MKNLIVKTSSSIKESLFKLEHNQEKCLIVIDEKGYYKGTLNDGDVRRAILLGANINSKIKKYVKKNSFYLKEKDLEKKENVEIIQLINNLKKEKIDIIPVLTITKKIKTYLSTNNTKTELSLSNKVNLKNIPLVIMAGGRGTRLKPFTEVFPKPLIPVNNIPAVEHIIRFFNKSDIKKIFLTLNYKKKLIRSYFEDNIFKLKYIEEKKEMGTAGSLSLLKNKIKSDFFCCNCDTLLKINLEKFYDYHKKGKFMMTLVVATKNYGVPYGSCLLDKNGNLKKIVEKPNNDYLINTGLYIMKKNTIDIIHKNNIKNMDELIRLITRKKMKIGVFPISDSNWTDVGEWSEYNKLILNTK